MNGMYVVTLGFQIAPGNRIVSIRVTSRYNFQCHIWKNLIKQTSIASKERVHRHLGQKLPLDIITLAVETPPVKISNAIFSRKSPIIIGHDVNGTYAVTRGYHFSHGNCNVNISVTSRYNF